MSPAEFALAHGGDMQRVALDSATGAIENPVDDLLALDEALTRFEQQWPDKAKLVKMKYFAGLTVPEAARAMDISTPTAERYWKFARAWLHSQLHDND